MDVIPLQSWFARADEEGTVLTVLDYPSRQAARARSFSWAQLDAAARRLAARLGGLTVAGDRVAVLLPNGEWYVASYLACLYAGCSSVPLFSPSASGHPDRLHAVLRHAQPAVVLGLQSDASTVRAVIEASVPTASFVTVDAVQDVSDHERPRGLVAKGSDVAHLQYTSGSTSDPAGVMISHDNLKANVHQCSEVLGISRESTIVSWLPMFHDMGLCLTLGPMLVVGSTVVLMDPAAFLMRPERWLHAMSDRTNVISASPNFGFDHCAKRVAPQSISECKLDGVDWLINGAEPVRESSVRAFESLVASTGLPAGAVRPSYGLAEATVFVTGSAGFHTLAAEPESLMPGSPRVLLRDAPGARRVVDCGRSAADVAIRIVDPDCRQQLPELAIGEIWIHGPNVTQGYWNSPGLTDERLCMAPDGTGPWLRTGDLGFLRAGQLHVTGRLKDLVIVDGANHYPEDIEQTVSGLDPALRAGRIAAVAVGDPGEEQLVVVLELADSDSSEGLASRVRRAVADRHRLAVRDVVVIRRGALPMTSSGKVPRHQVRSMYENGTLQPVAVVEAGVS